MEKLNKQMDDALNTKVAALNATDDETGDGKVDALGPEAPTGPRGSAAGIAGSAKSRLLRSQRRLLWRYCHVVCSA